MNKINYCNPRQKVMVLLTLLLTLLGFMKIAHAEYLIGAGDAISIKVYGYEDLNLETRVSDNGLITFPLLGDVSIGGQSAMEAGKTINQLLSKGGYIKNAQVTIVILDYKSQQVSVLGQVNKPGQFSLEYPSTLIDVIALAGGINAFGEDRAIITHHINGKISKEEVDIHKMLEFPDRSRVVSIQKGDIIYVPKAPVFYIHGEVQRPGNFRLEPNMTVSQAISVGGGLTQRGTLNGIVIERRDQNGQSKTISAELNDLILKDDVVVIDERLF